MDRPRGLVPPDTISAPPPEGFAGNAFDTGAHLPAPTTAPAFRVEAATLTPSILEHPTEADYPYRVTRQDFLPALRHAAPEHRVPAPEVAADGMAYDVLYFGTHPSAPAQGRGFYGHRLEGVVMAMGNDPSAALPHDVAGVARGSVRLIQEGLRSSDIPELNTAHMTQHNGYVIMTLGAASPATARVFVARGSFESGNPDSESRIFHYTLAQAQATFPSVFMEPGHAGELPVLTSSYEVHPRQQPLATQAPRTEEGLVRRDVSTLIQQAGLSVQATAWERRIANRSVPTAVVAQSVTAASKWSIQNTLHATGLTAASGKVLEEQISAYAATPPDAQPAWLADRALAPDQITNIRDAVDPAVPEAAKGWRGKLAAIAKKAGQLLTGTLGIDTHKNSSTNEAPQPRWKKAVIVAGLLGSVAALAYVKDRVSAELSAEGSISISSPAFEAVSVNPDDTAMPGIDVVPDQSAQGEQRPPTFVLGYGDTIWDYVEAQHPGASNSDVAQKVAQIMTANGLVIDMQASDPFVSARSLWAGTSLVDPTLAQD